MTTQEANIILCAISDAPLGALLEDAAKKYLPGAVLRFWDGRSDLALALGEDLRTLVIDGAALSSLRARGVALPGHLTLHILAGPEGETLSEGAYHYPRPVSLGILLDRLRQPPRRAVLEIGPYSFSPHESVLTHGKSGAHVRLTEKERDILLLLCGSAGAVVGRQVLLDNVWGYAPDIETHTLETHIYRLRQKIEDDPAVPVMLVTEDNGYRLNR